MIKNVCKCALPFVERRVNKRFGRNCSVSPKLSILYPTMYRWCWLADGKNNINLALLQQSNLFSIENEHTSSQNHWFCWKAKRYQHQKPNGIKGNQWKEVPLFSAISKNRFLSFCDFVRRWKYKIQLGHSVCAH